MTTRGLCVICSGNYAVAKDGTPYAHDLNDDTCPGSAATAVVGDLVWAVYGEQVNADFGESFPTSTSGPVFRDQVPDRVLWTAGRTLPLLGTFATRPTFGQIQDLLPTPFQVVAPE